jgi:hypothetical protein
MGPRFSIVVPRLKLYTVLAFALVIFAVTASVAQSSNQGASSQGGAQAANTATDTSKTAPSKTAPADNANHGLVEGAQEQIKRLQDYVNPPQPVKDMGNPEVKVWADLHTALYYCPGSKQYGHTSKGKYFTQKEAQDSNFEPALRVPCPPEPPASVKTKSAKPAKTAKKTAPANAAAPANKQPN